MEPWTDAKEGGGSETRTNTDRLIAAAASSFSAGAQKHVTAKFYDGWTTASAFFKSASLHFCESLGKRFKYFNCGEAHLVGWLTHG